MGCFVIVVVVFNFCSSAEVVFEKLRSICKEKKQLYIKTVPETGEYFRSLQGGKGVKNLKVYQMNN